MAVDRVIRDVSVHDANAEDMARSAIEQVEVAIRRLRRAADRRGLRLLGAAGTILLVGAATRYGADAGTHESAVVGGGSTAALSIVKRVVRGKPERDPFAFAFHAQAAFAGQ